MSMQSESLPDRAMERLWAKLHANYGARWARMFPVPPVPPGVDPGQHAFESIKGVQAVWAEELGRFAGNLGAIAYALANLPADPPNLPEFKALCNRRPDPKPDPNDPKLAAPEVNKVLASAVLAEAAKVAHRIGDHLTLIRGLMLREINGDRLGLTAFQREFWRKALKHEIAHLYGIDTSQPFDSLELKAAVDLRNQSLRAAA